MVATVSASALTLVGAVVGGVSHAGAVNISSAAFQEPLLASPASVIDGVPCPEVMVIAARGSGEAPSDWQNPSAYTSDHNHGAGATLYLMYKELVAANPGVTFSLAPVVYRADKVSVLLTNPSQYLSDPQTGEESIALDIQTTDAACGHAVRYILAGYSLGAWAVQGACKVFCSFSGPGG